MPKNENFCIIKNVCYNVEKIGCDFMADERIYKQVPVVQANDTVVCPICKNKGVFDTKLCKISLRKSKILLALPWNRSRVFGGTREIFA